MDIQKVSFQVMQEIIIKREPIGLFYTNDVIHEDIIITRNFIPRRIEDKTNFIACDNTSGDVYVEQFVFFEDCTIWLQDY